MQSAGLSLPTYVNLFVCGDKRQKLALMTQFTASLVMGYGL